MAGPYFNDPVNGWNAPGGWNAIHGIDPTQTGSIGGPLSGQVAAPRGILSGGGFGGLRAMLADPSVMWPIAAQLIGGATPQASFAGALNAAGPAFGDMRKRAAINAWLKSRSTGEPLSAEAQQMIAQDPVLAQKLAEHDLGLSAGAGGEGDYGLAPIFGERDGQAVVLQPRRSGGVAEAPLPAGVTLSKKPIVSDLGNEILVTDPVTHQEIGRYPKSLRAAEREKALGPIEAGREAALPNTLANADLALQTIQDVKDDPFGKGGIAGSGIGGTGTFSFLNKTTPAGVAFTNKIGQLQGQTFLDAYGALKGGGAITDIEGAKATLARSRVDAATTRAEFDKALDDLAAIIKKGKDRARRGVRVDPSDASANPKEFKTDQGGAAPAGVPADPLGEARAAIAAGAPRDAVIKRLQDNGIDPSGL